MALLQEFPSRIMKIIGPKAKDTGIPGYQVTRRDPYRWSNALSWCFWKLGEFTRTDNPWKGSWLYGAENSHPLLNTVSLKVHRAELYSVAELKDCGLLQVPGLWPRSQILQERNSLCSPCRSSLDKWLPCKKQWEQRQRRQMQSARC